MRFSHFFIARPIFAAVMALVVTIIGAIGYTGLGITQLPEITPPTITVTTTYPGASAQTVADTVAAPIEQEINGVEGMIYMASQSTSDGNVSVTVTFEVGTDIEGHRHQHVAVGSGLRGHVDHALVDLLCSMGAATASRA